MVGGKKEQIYKIYKEQNVFSLPLIAYMSNEKTFSVIVTTSRIDIYFISISCHISNTI